MYNIWPDNRSLLVSLSISRFRLSLEIWHLVRDHVVRELPNEACGILGGPPGEAKRVYPIANERHSPYEYFMEPAEQVSAMLAIEAAGWEVSGIFHSHPAGPSVPSRTDVAQAYYPEAVYFIIAPRVPGGWEMRGFSIVDGLVNEVALEVLE